MEELRSRAQESAEDIFFGQVVLIWARWFVIAAGVILVLWGATGTGEVTIYLVPIVLLMAVNFFLNGRYFMELPASRALLLAMSALDLLAITGTIWMFQGQVGLKSSFFVFYYPVIFAFALVFPARVSVGYTVAAIAGYAAVCWLADPTAVGDSAALKTLVMRVITIASTGLLGTYYWRIQRDRRRGANNAGSRIAEPRAERRAASSAE